MHLQRYKYLWDVIFDKHHGLDLLNSFRRASLPFVSKQKLMREGDFRRNVISSHPAASNSRELGSGTTDVLPCTLLPGEIVPPSFVTSPPIVPLPDTMPCRISMVPPPNTKSFRIDIRISATGSMGRVCGLELCLQCDSIIPSNYLAIHRKTP